MLRKVPSDHRLLILSCSQSKRPDSCLLPALSRYDGPPFRVLRKFLIQEPDQARIIDIYTLSAKFGLIPATRAIPYYDQRMTDVRVSTLKSCVAKQMERVLERKHYTQLFFGLGSDYLQAIEGYERLISPGVEVVLSNGTPGRNLTLLKDWLYCNDSTSVKPQASCPSKIVLLRGVSIRATPAQILTIARRALVNGCDKSDNYQSWYVLVDGQRVAPKWLVSQLSGLPVGDFHTGEAMRVLQQLCIEVHRS